MSRAAPDALLTAAHAWHVDPRELRVPATLDRALSLLCANERARYDRLQTRGAREEYLAARVLCRTTLSRYAGIDPTEWRFTESRYGKPTVLEPQRFESLHFNLSHTAGLVTCIVSRAGAVGVDVEDTSQKVDLSLVARHFLSRGEQTRLAALGARESKARFFEQWVLKEAYIKAIGTGLAHSPERLTVEERDDGRAISAPKCQLALYRPSAQHVAAAAVLRKPRSLPVAIEWFKAETSQL